MGSTYGFVKNSNMEPASPVPGKTRMSVQARSEGDGMENVSSFETRPSKKIFPSVPSNCPKTFPLSPGKRKEPKFVPYEPYKAAVSPMLPNPSQRQRRIDSGASAISFLPSLVSQEQEEESQREQRSVVSFLPQLPSVSQEEKEESRRNEIVSSEIKSSSTWLGEKVLLENKVTRLIEENQELQTQFKVQTKVNADLKKLLVASLGEDLQTKVLHMSEDKAKLGEHVLHFARLVSHNNEELEKLAAEGEVWKSKFEASSLLLDELSAWKVVLSSKFCEATDALHCMLDERREVHSLLAEAFGTLHRIQEAFDPNARRNSPCPESPWNVSQLASAAKGLTDDIQHRLIGNNGSDRAKAAHTSLPLGYTRGEISAEKVLASLQTLPALTKLEVSKRSGKAPVSLATCLHPAANGGASGGANGGAKGATVVNCCGQCSGEIRLV